MCVCQCLAQLVLRTHCSEVTFSVEAIHPDHTQKETLGEKSQAIRLGGQASTPCTQKTGERIKVQG